MSSSRADVSRSIALALLVVAVLLGTPSLPHASPSGPTSFSVSYTDPEGDAFGPGNYSYSKAFSDSYRAGYFDLREFSAALESGTFRVSATLTEVANPFGSPLGFSPQVIHIYIVGGCDHRRTDTMGLNVRLRAADAWCLAIIVTPNLGGYESHVVFADGRVDSLNRVYVNGSTIVAELPAALVVEGVGGDPSSWRYFVAVTAHDSHSPDGLLRISDKESEAPVFYEGATPQTLWVLPRVLDVLAETADDQYSMLGTFSAAHGDVATVVAYPYAEGLLLPPSPAVELITRTIVSTVTETYIKLYTIPGATTTTAAYVQVPKYGLELYALAFMSAALVVVLAAVLRRTTPPKRA